MKKLGLSLGIVLSIYAGIALANPRVDNLPAQVALMKAALEATSTYSHDPFGQDRSRMEEEVLNPSATFDLLFNKYFPHEVAAETRGTLTFQQSDAAGPSVRIDNLAAQVKQMERALSATSWMEADPFGGDRAMMLQQVANPDANFDVLYEKYFRN